MKNKNIAGIFNSTNPLKILNFLVENPLKEFLGSEIQKAVSLSRAGIYLSLRDLIKQNLVLKTQKGKFLLYSIDYNNPAIKQFKVLKNIILLQPVISKLKPFSKKIILYGSGSRGEDNSSSDIDLFILAADFERTKRALSAIRVERKIQPVIMPPARFADFKEKEKIFYEEIDRGIVIWEQKE